MQHIFQYSLIIILFILSNLMSDIIEKNNGETYKGIIKSSSDSSVIILVESQELSVAHHEIKSITFQTSDLLILSDKSELNCKIIRKEFPFTIVMREDGLEKFPSSYIKRYYYNFGEKIQFKYLPRTDDKFKNEGDYSISNFTSILQSNLRVSVSAGIAGFRETPIKNNTIEPFVSLYSFCLSYPVYQTLHLGLGYSKMSYFKSGTSLKFNSNHYFANFEYIHVLKDGSRFFPSIGLDLGYFDVQPQERIYFWPPGELKKAENNVFFNIRIGLTYFIIPSISNSFETGWYHIETSVTFRDVEYTENGYESFLHQKKIQLGGLNFRLSINIHLF